MNGTATDTGSAESVLAIERSAAALEAVKHGENSDVLPDGSVAVALTIVPAATLTLKDACPEPLVVTSVVPMNV